MQDLSYYFVVLFGSTIYIEVEVGHSKEYGCCNAQDDGGHAQHNGGVLEASVTSACWLSTFL